jgi:hypothetical protein
MERDEGLLRRHPGFRQVNKARLRELIAQAPGLAMARMTEALAIYLGE